MLWRVVSGRPDVIAICVRPAHSSGSTADVGAPDDGDEAGAEVLGKVRDLDQVVLHESGDAVAEFHRSSMSLLPLRLILVAQALAGLNRSHLNGLRGRGLVGSVAVFALVRDCRVVLAGGVRQLLEGDEERGGDEDRRVGTRDHADEQRQRDIHQRTRTQGHRTDDKDRTDGEKRHNRGG